MPKCLCLQFPRSLECRFPDMNFLSGPSLKVEIVATHPQRWTALVCFRVFTLKIPDYPVTMRGRQLGPTMKLFFSSGFQTSRFRNARVSCLQDPRNAEPRLLQIFRHASQMDGRFKLNLVLFQMKNQTTHLCQPR
jgi:hypothetical protein